MIASAAYAHPGHVGGHRVGGHDLLIAQKEPAAEVPPADDNGFNPDAQRAFFNYELMTEVALRCPTPNQQGYIDCAYEDHLYVNGSRNRAKGVQRTQERAVTFAEMTDEIATLKVNWTDQGPSVSPESEAIEIANGLASPLLVRFDNNTTRALRVIHIGTEGPTGSEQIVLPGDSACVLSELLATDSSAVHQTVKIKDLDTETTHELLAPVRVVEPAILKGRLVDLETGEPTPGKLRALGSDNIFRRGERYKNHETLRQKELLKFWQLGKYYQLPFFYSDGEFEVVVPPGKVKVSLERGFEHEIVQHEYNLRPGETREVELSTERFSSLAEEGWVSGDTHVHWVINQWDVDLPLDLLATVQRAEDLRVANNLTLLQRGPSKAFINPQQAPMGAVERLSDSEYHIEMGEEYRNEDLYGHLCFLNLDWLVQPIGTGSIIAGPDALDYPTNKTAILACREQGGISIEAHGLGGNKDVPVNVVHGLTDSLDQIRPEEYYRFLECGFHLPLTNGSDHPARVIGCARAYVKVDGEYTYDKWIQGIRDCRTFTTSGPLLSLKVNGADIGDTLDVSPSQTLTITAKVESRKPVEVIEIVSHGSVLASKRIDARRGELTVEIPAEESRWIVARCGDEGSDFNALQSPDTAHTSAIYVEVNGVGRFTPDAAELWIDRMRQHIRDIKAKGRFANDSQRDEAISYVKSGIARFEALLRDHEANQAALIEQASTEVTTPISLPGAAEQASTPACERCATEPTDEPEQAESYRVEPPSSALLVKADLAASQPSASLEASWPQADPIDAQPLLLQVSRLVEALDYIGNPLPPSIKEQIEALRDETNDAVITERVQTLLDPLCLAAVSIADGEIAASPGPVDRKLMEQGWRSFLVKVCNDAALTTRLHVESPNARPMPHAKAEDVASRWMGLSMFDGRPMQASLSGLPLEYRIVQAYSRDEGEHDATIEFSIDAKPGTRGRLIKEWRFDEGPAGWEAANQVEIEARDGSLHVESLGSDPFVTAEVGGASGELLLRFWAQADSDGVAQVFFWTEEQPAPDANRVVTIPLMPGAAQQYEAAFKVDGVLAGVRIDPNVKASHTRIDWVDLSYAHRRGETWTSLPMKFSADPAVEVTVRVDDKHEGANAAAFIVRDKMGRIYPEQSKRLAPDLFFQPQVYRLDGEKLYLPPGDYEVEAWRGPESIREKQRLVVGNRATTLTHRVNRWIDPSDHGWWSGDHHIHAAGCLHYQNPTQGVRPEHMMRQIMGEDMHVGCCLTWGPCFDYQKRFFTGNDFDQLVYPFVLRYDVEVSGFGSHASGHLNLLRLTEQIYPGGESKDHWPTLGMNTLRWAKAQGAVCGTAHSGSGLTRYIDNLGIEDGPNGLPHYNIPAFDGIGANEYIMDVTHELPGPDGELIPALDFIATMNTPRKDEWNIWYHTLNCGYRVRASGETDFPCLSGERVGIGRIYVQLDNRLNYPEWVQGVQDGRSYVSDAKAHLMDFRATTDRGDKVSLGIDGSELRIGAGESIRFEAECAALINKEQHASPDAQDVEVELIVNGYPAAAAQLKADGTIRPIALEATLDKSSWVALRVHPHAHTNPIFVVVDDKPIRASRDSAEWCLRSVEQCWQMKKSTYKVEEINTAKADYEHARMAYEQILAECE